MSAPESVGERGQPKRGSHRSPPLAILVLFCSAFLLLQFDEADYSGWLRLVAIWAATLGFCLLSVAAAYSFTRLRKRPAGVILSNSAYALCVIACCWAVILGIRDTRRALDPNRWLEIGTEMTTFPFEVEEGQTFYTLNLDPKLSDGLHRIQTTGTQKLLWPADRRAGEGNKLLWWGWHCTVRNRGMHSLSDITFDAPVSYTYGGATEPKEWAVHHAYIRVLAPNESIELLLGSDRDGVYVGVYQPKLIVARVGNETNKRTLRTRLLPFKEPWSGLDYWFLVGPDETPSFNASEPAKTKPLD